MGTTVASHARRNRPARLARGGANGMMSCGPWDWSRSGAQWEEHTGSEAERGEIEGSQDEARKPLDYPANGQHWRIPACQFSRMKRACKRRGKRRLRKPAAMRNGARHSPCLQRKEREPLARLLTNERVS